MFFRQLLHEEKACLSYLIGCSSKGVVAVIDPQIHIEPYIQIAKQHNLTISHIIETHVQADHLSGAQVLSEATHVPVYFHAKAPVLFPHKQVEDGDILRIGNRTISILYTPGHTNDSMSLFVDNWFVLTGDTLFVGDVGRVDLSVEYQNSLDISKQAEKLYDSIHTKLLPLPDYIELYPTHYGGSSCGKHMDGKPISTIGYEKKGNIALQIQSKEKFATLLTTDIPLPPADYHDIKLKNLGKT